jgi:hypothetical protein
VREPAPPQHRKILRSDFSSPVNLIGALLMGMLGLAFALSLVVGATAIVKFA